MLVLDGGTYRLVAAYSEAETLKSTAFPDLEIALQGVFDFPLEPEDRVQLVKEGTPPYAARGQG